MSIELLVSRVTPKAGVFALPLEQQIIKAGIEQPIEVDHLLAQIAHESQGFAKVEENLQYSAKRLLEVFPKYFKSESIAQVYAYNPVKIANRIYANRLGNGTEESGDGYKYRGMGLIQTTGKLNVKLYSIDTYGDMRVLDHPTWLTHPDEAAKSAVWFWKKNGCGKYALKNDIKAVSGIVNRGDPNKVAIGMQDRIYWFNKIRVLRQELFGHV